MTTINRKVEVGKVYDDAEMAQRISRAATIEKERPSEFLRRVVREAVGAVERRQLDGGRPLPPLAGQ